MQYSEALQKIHSLLTFGSRPGLDRMKMLLKLLGNPQDNLKFIHVAGTNGKGSVCEMLSSILVKANYKTGLFISPYITDFRERIQINNELISEKMLADAVEKTFPIVEKLNKDGIIITEFEYVNALQFYIHSKENCDVVVLETGLGGLLDSTNVINSPLCSIITTIGLDHTAILGDTLEQIAKQKCGIIKENSLVISSNQQNSVKNIIKSTCQNQNAPCYFNDDINLKVINESLNSNVVEYENTTLTLNLAGKHQIENLKTVLCAIKYLNKANKLNISISDIQLGIKNAINPARLETLCKNPIIILDGAHNPNGIMSLVNAVSTHLANKKVIGIIGMLADKDSESSLKMLEKTFAEVCTVPVNNPRALSSEQLADKCKNHFNNVIAFSNVMSAFDYAYDKAKKNDYAIIVCGSLYLAGEIRPYILEKTK